MECDPLFTIFANGSSIDSGDADNLQTTGSWSITSPNVANIPLGYGVLVVYKTPNYVMQIYYRPDRIYVRRYAGSWSEWKSVALS
jgi:hypothetical protein